MADKATTDVTEVRVRIMVLIPTLLVTDAAKVYLAVKKAVDKYPGATVEESFLPLMPTRG